MPSGSVSQRRRRPTAADGVSSTCPQHRFLRTPSFVLNHRYQLTDQHLRDGFTRAVLARQKLARSGKRLTEADETVGHALPRLSSDSAVLKDGLAHSRITAVAQGALPRPVCPEGQSSGPLAHTRRPGRRVRGECDPSYLHTAFHSRPQGTQLGFVSDPWVAKELMMAYFADKDVISPKVRRLCDSSATPELTAQLKQDVAEGFESLYKP